MPIIVYNRNNENHSGDKNNYPIYRPNILSNPYTHIKDRTTLASYVVDTREEAIQQYDHYFDVMYSGNKEFRRVINEIYEKYKNGETIYLECYCVPAPCHGNIIAKKLQRMLVRELAQKTKNECQKEMKADTTL